MNAIDTFLQGVSNKSLCNWFFIMYILALAGATYQILFILFSVFNMKNKGFGIALVVVSSIVLSISVLQSLFLYSLCDRSLSGKSQ